MTSGHGGCSPQGLALPDNIDVVMLQKELQQGRLAVVLISSYSLNQSKSPHWVLMASISDTFVYFHGPDIDWEENKV